MRGHRVSCLVYLPLSRSFFAQQSQPFNTDMSLAEWYGNCDVLLTGVTSDLGRVLLEKLLRSFPNVNIYTVLRSRGGFNKDDRIKNIFATAGFERLRQQEPTAINRVKALEGNLLYEDLGMSEEDLGWLSNVQVVFHAAGPHDDVLEFCCSQRLSSVRSVASASDMFRHRGKITESLQNEKVPSGIPLALVRIPILGPAHKEPMPGLVQILRGPTALMIGAGFALGRADLQAQVAPVDLVANALIAAAWERGRGRSQSGDDGPTVYNMPALDCTWGTLVKKGSLANRKFAYPTFGIRGMTSVAWLHWAVVLILEWFPSLVCDTILSIFGAKPRCVAEEERVQKALRSLESIASRSWPVERNRIRQLHQRLSPEDRETFPICPEIEIESYVLCSAAMARKYCVNEVNIKIVQSFTRFFFVLVFAVFLCFVFK